MADCPNLLSLYNSTIMFGTLRFVLALLVVLSHLGILFYGRNIGVMAVVSFFMLSGYSMGYLFSKTYTLTGRGVIAFYVDRLLRLFPLYFVVALAAYFFFHFSHFAPDITWSKRNIFYNVTVIFLNFYMYTPMWLFTYNNNLQSSLLPQAWYLALELQYYLVLPLLIWLRRSPGTIVTISIASLVVWMAAVSSYLNPDAYGYRLLPGVMFLFILGMVVFEHTKKKNAMPLWMKILWTGILGVFFWLTASKHIFAYYSYEVLIGYLIGFPTLWYLAHHHIFPKKFDDFMGNLSYPIFLSHFPIIWLFDFLGFQGNERTALVLVTTFFSSMLLFECVENPARQLRYWVRNRFQ